MYIAGISDQRKMVTATAVKTISVLLRILHERELEGIYGMQMFADIFSAVTIIVVTIFIAIFQNYRIVFLSRYFLCVRNDIFAWYLLCKHDRFTTSLVVYSSFSMLQSRVANDVTRVIAARRPWLSSISVRERRCNCFWSNRVAGGLRVPSRLYDVTTQN